MSTRYRNGFSLIEVLAVMALAAIVFVKVGLLVRMRAQTDSQENTAMIVEDQARSVMERISYALMGTARDRLRPTLDMPLYSNELRYQASLGIDEKGEVVWDEPETLGLGDVDSQVVWRRTSAGSEEQRVVWCNSVRPFLEGELINGMDDNGNGLIDEKGLTFSLHGSLVTVRLSLHRVDEDGKGIVRSLEMSLTIRN